MPSFPPVDGFGIRVDDAARVFVITVDGEVTSEALLACLAPLAADPAHWAAWTGVWDVRRMRASFTLGDIARLREAVEQGAFPVRRAAGLHDPASLLSVVSSLFVHLLRGRYDDLRLFRTEAEVAAWTGLPVERLFPRPAPDVVDGPPRRP